MTRCPDCDGPLEYDAESGDYYCPRCEKHLDRVEVEEEKTIYQDTTENPTPDTNTYWDEKTRADEEDEETPEE